MKKKNTKTQRDNQGSLRKTAKSDENKTPKAVRETKLNNNCKKRKQMSNDNDETGFRKVKQTHMT